MNVKFTGKIIAAGQVQMGTSQNGTQWSSQEYVIEELNQQYPSRAVIQVYGSDKIQQFGIQLGEIITANIGLKAHQSRDGRWFNQLDCWKVERPNAQQQGQMMQRQIGQVPQQQAANYPPQQMQASPPQVNANGQPIQQNAQYAGGQQQGLPFPAPNQ
nr:MAG TPA: protein of unknown function (DUF3127) [Caudoviricetes sp.]